RQKGTKSLHFQWSAPDAGGDPRKAPSHGTSPGWGRRWKTRSNKNGRGTFGSASRRLSSQGSGPGGNFSPGRSPSPKENVQKDDGGDEDARGDQSEGNGALPPHRPDQGAAENLPQGSHLSLGGQDGGPEAGIPNLLVEPRAVDGLVGFSQNGGHPVSPQGHP